MILVQLGLYITSGANAYDEGNFTGEIRRSFGMVSLTDIRNINGLMLSENDVDLS